MKRNVLHKYLAIAMAGGLVLLCSCNGQTEGKQEEQSEQLKEEEPKTITMNEEETETTVGNEEEDYMSVFEELAVTKSYKGMDDTNPLMTQRFGADPYAMVYEDRVYIYMTADAFEYDGAGKVVENTYGKINQINVISTADMVNFTDHGSVKAASNLGSAKWARNSWAPAAAWKEIDGKPKFFLYFADAGGGIGVLCSDSPTGPFTDPLGEPLISRQTPNCADVLWLFDPAVLMDDDGKAYIYFGGGVPEGKVADPGTARVAELGEDMISIVGEPITIDVPYLFEDSGIHKAAGKYFYTYCTNWQVDEAGTEKYGFYSGEIACMVSDSPMGPFTYKETILKNPGSVFGLSGNNHHCVFQFQDQWYIAYHTRVLEQAMDVEKGYRCTHIDAFEMEEDGSIGVINQTLNGREQIKYVDAYERNRAASFAVMGGIDTVPADSTSSYYGCGNMALGDIQSGDFVKTAGVDFGSTSPVSVCMTFRDQEDMEASGAVEIRLDSLEGEVLGYLSVGNLQEGREFTESVAELSGEATGVHDLYFIFAGEGYEIEEWQFLKD